MAITINPISPVAVSIFGFDLRWYALAYIFAFVVGGYMYFRLMRDKKSGIDLSKKQFDDLVTAVILGVILGGRLGYVLFYNFSYFLQNPLEIFAVWNGGMSFHGGMLGVIAAVFLYARRVKIGGAGTWFSAWKILDLMTVVAPIGLFFGRIANFINMEVMGRVTELSWGVIFNGHDTMPRHASPLYEAVTEGLLLFIIMFCLCKYTKLRDRAGALSGIAAVLYAVFRIFCEQFRQPDAQIGFLTSWGLTMGQLLSGFMIFMGITIFAIAFRKK